MSALTFNLKSVHENHSVVSRPWELGVVRVTADKATDADPAVHCLEVDRVSKGSAACGFLETYHLAHYGVGDWATDIVVVYVNSVWGQLLELFFDVVCFVVDRGVKAK